MYVPTVFNSMDCKSRQNLGLRLLIYSFMVLPLSSLCIQIWSILLQYQKVRGGSSVKLFALEGDSSYFNPKFSFQNVIPIFSNTIILLMTLKSILPTLRLLKSICLALFMVQPRCLASVSCWFCLSSVFSNTSCLYEIIYPILD